MEENSEPAREAMWWTPGRDGRLRCELCPRGCLIAEGQFGYCAARKNENGRLVSVVYGRPSALHVDPIEKKPLNHFLPGTDVLSLGTAGCNLGCRYCQNWGISKSKDSPADAPATAPRAVVDLALRYRTPSIAFTYNEPSVFGEYVIDIARIAQAEGLKTVMVTNGYVTEQAFRDIYAHIDGANVDLKAFSEAFYRKLSHGHLRPVLDTLLRLRRETNVWFEITNLLIPGENDSPEETREMSEWIAAELGADTPVHFTAFHPDFRMPHVPRTAPDVLDGARAIALQAGLRYVYVGNVSSFGGQTTVCPKCGEALIQRDWRSVSPGGAFQGRCPLCAEAIAGRWS